MSIAAIVSHSLEMCVFCNLCHCLFCYVRLKKSCAGEKDPFRDKHKTSKLPLKPIDNLGDQWEDLLMMAHRKLNFDADGKENGVMAGNKLPRSNAVNIKDKISLWEGKEPSAATSSSSGIIQTGSLTRGISIATDKSANGNRILNGKDIAEENVGKRSKSRPCSPTDPVKQGIVTVSCSKPSESQKEEDSSKDNQAEKENLGNVGSSSPCSPAAVTEKQQVGSLKRNERKTAEPSQEKRAVFSLFKKLEAMGDHQNKTPTELGNYFSPPSKNKQEEVKKKDSAVKSQETVYTEPESPPINPVPKPRRTFQHPAHTGTLPRQGRGQRNLPPLPSFSTQTSSKPPSGSYRSRAEGVRDNR